MTEAKIREMLEHGENLTTEYKKSVSEISHSVYETVSSFSNRYGGYILLGVEEINHKGHVIGVNRNAAPAMKKNFANALDNDEIIYPCLYPTLEDFEIDGGFNGRLLCGTPHRIPNLQWHRENEREERKGLLVVRK